MLPKFPDLTSDFSIQGSFDYASLSKLFKRAKYLHIYLSTIRKVFPNYFQLPVYHLINFILEMKCFLFGTTPLTHKKIKKKNRCYTTCS